jgi:hypothetical protein
MSLAVHGRELVTLAILFALVTMLTLTCGALYVRESFKVGDRA